MRKGKYIPEGIDFCHIMPTAFLNTWGMKYNTQLVLAHLVEQDKEYANFFIDAPNSSNFGIRLEGKVDGTDLPKYSD